MGKRDVERFERTGLVMRSGELVPMEKVRKVEFKPSVPAVPVPSTLSAIEKFRMRKRVPGPAVPRV